MKQIFFSLSRKQFKDQVQCENALKRVELVRGLLLPYAAERTLQDFWLSARNIAETFSFDMQAYKNPHTSERRHVALNGALVIAPDQLIGY